MPALFVAPGYFKDAPFPGSKPLGLPPAEPGPAPPVGKIRIRVTRDDIRQGIRGNSGWCPVARASARALNVGRLGDGKLDVCGTRITRYPGIDVPLPVHVTARIVAYDFFRFMVPFSFTVKVPK